MKTVIWVVVAILLVLGVVYFLNNKKAAAPTNEAANTQVTPTPNPTPTETPTPTPNPSETPTPTPNPAPNPNPPPASNPTTVTISMKDNAFSPSSITVKSGTVVVFKNDGTQDIWPASNPHPTHTDYPGFDPKKAIAPGDSWSFTFNNVGTWGYHDHLFPSKRGTIIVTQ